MLISAAKSVLIVVDVQERLAPATAEPERVVENCTKLIEAAKRLDVSMLFSEQYPKGLGHTVEPLRSAVPAESFIDKIHFSCADEPKFAARVREMGARQAIVAGMEAHVCVLQTAIGLKQEGHEVYVVADAVTSRVPENKALALERMAANGCEIVSTEMVLFEWMGRAGTPEFKDISRLIK